MMAWMDDTALERTLESRRATYYSRSRQQYWVKGETSGHFQHVHDVRIDGDGDTLLLIVDQDGAACHTGSHSCFDTPSLLPGSHRTTTDVHTRELRSRRCP